MNYQRYEKAIMAYFKAQRTMRETPAHLRWSYLKEEESVAGCSCEKGWKYHNKEHLAELHHIAAQAGIDAQVFKYVMERRDIWNARTVLRPWFKKLNFHENLVGKVTLEEAMKLYAQWLGESKKREPEHFPKWRR